MSLNILLGPHEQARRVMALPELPAVFPGARPPSEILARDLPGYLKTSARANRRARGAPGPRAKPGLRPAAVRGHGQGPGENSLKVSFASFMDETAAMCDLILPGSLTLERFDDVVTPYGSAFCSYTLVKPLLAPIYDTKPRPTSSWTRPRR
jgi:hypothetical protein